MKNWMALACCLAMAACDTDEKALDRDTCLSNAGVPGILAVTAEPRADVIAEVLALECGDGVAASESLYQELAADLALIEAADTRMRLARDGGQGVYRFSSPFANPPRLSAEGDNLAAAKGLLAEETCAARLTRALHGTATDVVSVTVNERIKVEFAPRLKPELVAAAYAELGVTLTIQSTVVGDGSHVAFREIEGGREYAIALAAGDCPSGCSTARDFQWTVVAGHARLVAEYGYALGASDRGTYEPPPQGLDVTGFGCR